MQRTVLAARMQRRSAVRRRLCSTALAVGAVAFALAAADSEPGWAPVEGVLLTRWAADIDPSEPLPEYPRPQMRRAEWRSLNGLWDYAIRPAGDSEPASFDGRILVPFAVESALSGVGRPLSPNQKLWYRRTFEAPPSWRSGRLLLHFGAVDWESSIFVNGKLVGRRRGGFTPFELDITDALVEGREQRLTVAVTDPTDTATQPRGKQALDPKTIWYTAVSGIWQTVWLEPVPPNAVSDLTILPDIDRSLVEISVGTRQRTGSVRLVASIDGTTVAEATGRADEPIKLTIPRQQLWSPETPRLYDLRVSLHDGGREIDAVDGYFGMRKISLGPDEHGRTRLLLNDRPYFQLGPLDQGWWPDGLYTAPTEEALLYDIELTKKLGFNMARKHVKVEPARWYYHCDRLGLLVWQDMPNGSLPPGTPGSLRVEPGEPDARRPAGSARWFEQELREMVGALRNHPSIVVWVPFNEGWGQYDTARVTRLVRELDPSRLIDATSGWADRGEGDMIDAHVYPGPGMEPPEANRASVLGEFGGVSLAFDGHLWVQDRNWGYAARSDRRSLQEDYTSLLRSLRGLWARGLSAAIYTQTTDVEREINGLVTYDRAEEKFDAVALRRLHAGLYGPAPRTQVIAPNASEGAAQWSYTFSQPPGGWPDAARWPTGPGAFQSGENKLFSTGTKWESEEIWLSREFDVEHPPTELWLTLLHGFQEGEVLLNGETVLEIQDLRPTRRHYSHFDLSRHARLLRPGTNVIALRARAADGWRAIDAGLYGTP